MFRYTLFLLVVTAMLVSACGGDRTPAPAPNVRIEEVYMSLSEMNPSDRTAPVYMTLSNTGSAPDRLVSASSTVAKSVLIRDGVTNTVVTGGVEIPAGSKVEFKPSGYHVLIGVPDGVTAGSYIPLGLLFQGGDQRVVSVVVRP